MKKRQGESKRQKEEEEKTNKGVRLEVEEDEEGRGKTWMKLAKELIKKGREKEETARGTEESYENYSVARQDR